MLYDYRCKHCGTERDDVYNSIDTRHTNAPVCCYAPMEIVIKTAPYGFVDRDIRYRCPVTNEGVTSRKQRNEIMARESLIDANDIVNKKTIAARTKEAERVKKIVEDNRNPEVQKYVDKLVAA